MTEATDWDRYYRNTPKYTSITRAISTKKIIALIKRHVLAAPMRICEIGGANSCFVDAICREVDVPQYHIVDMNAYGLSLLSSKTSAKVITHEKGDVLAPYDHHDTFDLVFSVGLIEHFDPVGTRKAIDGHFARCRPGGSVLITFPTPTLLYRAIRSAAEASGKWAFPDERPLEFEEVLKGCQAHGTVIHTSINWPIGLTQGYVVTAKGPIA